MLTHAPQPQDGGPVPLSTEGLLRQFKSLLVLFVSAYSCTVGTLLVVFVPQRCTTLVGGGRNVTATVVDSECTFAQNVYEAISPYNAGVLVVSFLTVAALAYGFYIEAQRDAWIVRKFNADHSKPDDLLRQELDVQLHPENAKLREKLVGLNRHYYRVFATIACLWGVNVVLSAVVCFYYYFQDYVSCAARPACRPPPPPTALLMPRPHSFPPPPVHSAPSPPSS